MASRLAENRRRLIQLIYGLGDFDEPELVERFKRDRGGRIALDGAQNLSDCLQELRDIGVLRYEYGRYHVADQPNEPRIHFVRR